MYLVRAISTSQSFLFLAQYKTVKRVPDNKRGEYDGAEILDFYKQTNISLNSKHSLQNDGRVPRLKDTS